MIVRAEIDIIVSMGGVSHDGTGFQGYLPEGSRYEDIVRVFGQPQFGESLDQKIKCEWVGKVCGLVFTIYDYKSRVEPELNACWHIGGKVKLVSKLVNLYLHSK